MNHILNSYGIDVLPTAIKSLGNGLINTTWLVVTEEEKYVLQKINTAVFKNPTLIANNISTIKNFLQIEYPNYLFVAPLQTLDERQIVIFDDGYYRLFPFVKGSYTLPVVENEHQAFEAAKQFGQFTYHLRQLKSNELSETLPNFHNLSLRYQQFEKAVEEGNVGRIYTTADLIDYLLSQKEIVDEYEETKHLYKVRATHHDTKISNVLFDIAGNGLCVIDLDTVMPGHFISDVGDMMRTYLCAVNEEESDLLKIEIRPRFYKAIVDGYCSEMGEELNDFEKKQFAFAGKYMIYMQAIRFLTDYLNDDVYYGKKYETHNLVRAKNQAALLQKFNAFITHLI
jgi:aminoglycoside phosphotransferase (APT) family kinase protein